MKSLIINFYSGSRFVWLNVSHFTNLPLRFPVKGKGRISSFWEDFYCVIKVSAGATGKLQGHGACSWKTALAASAVSLTHPQNKSSPIKFVWPDQPHRYLIPRLSLKVVYLWRHVSSTAPPFILWWWNLETLFSPLNRSSPFIGELRCQAIQMEHALI
jgi:hypothetical protein